MQLQDHTETILTPAEPPQRLGPPNVHDAPAAVMYESGPELRPMAPPNGEVAALRANRPASDVLYPAHKQFNQDMLRELALAVTPDSDAKVLEQQKVEIGYLASDMGMRSADVQMLVALVKDAIANPVTAEESAKQGRKAQAELRDRYGDAGYAKAAADAKALAMRDPRFAGLVKRYGLNNHPELVLRLADLGREQRAAGRLK
jgi:hypothetical protein